METDIGRQLSAALKHVDRHYARLVTDTMTEIEPHPAPFLTHHRIYRIEHFSPHKPVLFYVGFAPGKRAYLLTGTPANYAQMARADGVALETPDAAEAYAAVYLEATRSMSELFYPVRSVDEVKIRPNLDEEDAEDAAAFVEQYRPVIAPPVAAATEGGYTVTAYAVRNQTLERHRLTLSRDGALHNDVTILEEDLPLVYGL